MVLKRPNAFILITLVVAWFFDLLFWKQRPGISFAIFVTLVLGAGFYLAWQEGKKAAKPTLFLLAPIAFFAVMSFVRAEPLTTFLNIVATLGLMMIFVHSFLGGRWPLYSVVDHITGMFQVGISALGRQVAVFTAQNKHEDAAPVGGFSWRKALPYLRGLLLALPVVLIFTGLLSSADPIFQGFVENFLNFLNIENIVDLGFRGILIMVVAYLLTGVYLHAFYKNHDETLGEKPGVKPFLGFTEATIILGSVNILFAAFVAVQFRYFFGGQTMISTGLTYSEYARRGFSELVWVAFFSLLLYLGLSAVTTRESQGNRNLFSGLGILLVFLVGVILVSAIQRLLLYEDAYGFTRLRTFTHFFIFWLGALLAVVVVLEMVKRQNFFPFAALLACIGFAATLNIVNVDAFIVKQNVARGLNSLIKQGDGVSRITQDKLDIAYLASLSDDIVPTLSDLYRENQDQREAVAGVLACHAAINDFYAWGKDPNWQSIHLSHTRAWNEWQAWQDTAVADQFQVQYGEKDYLYSAYVVVWGQEVKCIDYRYID